MIRYVKCPRCELNYIDADSQEYCDVCIAEMKGARLEFADLDDEELEEELDNDLTEICPVCGINHIRFGDSMCEACKNKSEFEEEEEVDPEQDEEWKNYLNDDSEDLTLDDEELDEELREEFEDEEDEEDDGYGYNDSEDDFDDDLESLDDLDDYDDDDDDEDDGDDDLF